MGQQTQDKSMPSQYVIQNPAKIFKAFSNDKSWLFQLTVLPIRAGFEFRLFELDYQLNLF